MDKRTALGELILYHGGEWTEADYEALPDGVRAELHDGQLILLPGQTAEHSMATMQLSLALERITSDRQVIHRVDMRMAEGRRFRTPDVVVWREWQRDRPIDPRNVVMVCEIISPRPTDERGDKMTAYAEAGIEWYLVAEETSEGFLAELYRLKYRRYDLLVKAPPAGSLTLPAPFDVEIDLSALVLSIALSAGAWRPRRGRPAAGRSRRAR